MSKRRSSTIIAKAAPPAPEDGVHRLTEMETQFVSLVPKGANRQSSFFVVKADAAKAVPAADAAPEDKRAAQADRASKYGIEATEGGAALSFPADGPTSEALYGDPVNLKYPLATAGNARDADRIRNAVARFKANAGAYQQDKSKGAVYARIVTAALAAGIAVSYDPNDPIDKLLPADLKRRLEEKAAASAPPAPPADGKASPPDAGPAAAVDLAAWIARAAEAVDALAVQQSIADHLKVAPVTGPSAPAAPASVHKVDPVAAPTTVPEVETMKAELTTLRRSAGELAAARAQIAKLEREVVEERARAERLRAGVGRTTALPAATPAAPAAPDTSQRMRAWRAGSDLARR